LIGCDTAEIGTFYLELAAFFSNLQKAAWLIESTLSTKIYSQKKIFTNLFPGVAARKLSAISGQLNSEKLTAEC
jgi:hypothetical protein